MIKDLHDTENYFNNAEELIAWLGVDKDIEQEMTLSLDYCMTEQDYVDYANEYILKSEEGIQTHEFVVVK